MAPRSTVAPSRTAGSSRRILALACAFAVLPLCSQEAVPYLEAGAGWRQGDFGTRTRSTLWMGAATFGAFGARWDASLTVPALRVTREGDGSSVQDRGLGDIVARGTCRLLAETEDGWSVDATAALKLPTASESKGLGTGRADAAALLALNQQLGLFQWSLLAGRIEGAAGDPGGSTEPLTPGAFVLGARTAWAFEGTRWSLGFEARGPAYQGLPGAREVTAALFQPLTTRWAVKASVTAGLTDGGPRTGFALSVVRIFP